MYQRILTPLDGSDAAEVVLPYAEEIAAKSGAQVAVVSVSEASAAETDHLYRSYLERVTERVQRELTDWGAAEAKVQYDILLGKPAREILRYAEEHNVSLIAMASLGRSERGPWLLGNIAAKVLRATDKPVLLIRAPASGAALQQRRLVNRILVPLDGSAVGETAIPHVEALARVLGAELVLFHVLEPVPIVPAIEGGAAFGVMYDEESRRTPAMAYLNSLRKAYQEKGVSTSTVVTSGAAADQIIDYAKANTVDLIAMSTHGRSGIGRWVFGSVTDKVLHAGDTPIMTVRATKSG